MSALTLTAVVGTLLSVACTESAPTPLEPPAAAAVNGIPSQGHGMHRAQFVQISAGAVHTCALRMNGSFYCWGGDDVGQIGIAPNATCDLATGTGVPCVAEPTRITGSGGGGPSTSLQTASLVSAGGAHTCALSFGRAWCWGANQVGQTGVSGGGSAVATPTVVSTAIRFHTLDAGGNMTCALSLTSSLYCWGERWSHVSLGTTPTLYSYITGRGVGVDVNYTNGCVQGLRGGWRCFGDNSRGELATDPTLLLQSVPLVATALTKSAKRVVTSNYFMCAELDDGTVSCVGNDADLQLGGGPVSGPGSYSYTPVIVGGGIKLHGITAGGNHVCGLDVDSKAWCWGENTNGELGNGVGGNTSVPQAVSGGIKFRQLSAGGSHTCGIAVDNTIYCWGANRHGEVGDPAFVLNHAYTPHPTAAPKG